MTTCPYCGREIPEGASVCRWCRSDLAATPAGRGVAPQRSGKAIASLVLGIYSFIAGGICTFPWGAGLEGILQPRNLLMWLLPATLTVVYGHVSRGERVRSAGRLRGGTMALAGLILGYAALAMLPLRTIWSSLSHL